MPPPLPVPVSAGVVSSSPRRSAATMARAASGRELCLESLLHPRIVRRVGVHGGAAVIDRPRGAARSARARCRRSGTARTRRRARTATPRHRRARCRPRPPTRGRTCRGWPPSGRLPLPSRTSTTASRSSCSWYSGERQPLSTTKLDPVVRGIGRRPAQGTEQSGVEVGHARDPVVEDRRAVGDGAVGLAERTTVLGGDEGRRSGERGAVEDEDAGSWWPRAAAIAATTTSRPATRILRIRIRRVVVRAGSLEVTPPVKAACALPARMRFSIRRRYAPARSIGACAC